MTTLAAPSAGRRGGLLHHRDFRLFWLGQATSKFGSTITSVALPLVAIAGLDATTLQVALVQAAVWLPWLLIGLPAGAWVDRLPRRPVMIACDGVSMVLFLSVPIAAWLQVLTVAQLVVVALLAGTASVFFEAAYHVFLPSLLGPEQLAEGNAKLHGTEAAAHVAGPGVGGLLAQAFGAVTGVLADAASFAVSTLCLLSLRHREAPVAVPAARRSLRREIAEGLRFLVRDPYLRVLAATGAVCNLALVGYQSILLVFLIREVGVSAGTAGGLLAGMGLGGVVGALLAPRVARRLGSARGLLASHLGLLPCALLIPLTGPGPRLALLVLGGIAVGIGVAIGNVIIGSFRQRYTPRHLLGRVISSIHLINYGTIPVGALLAGVLGTTLGLRPTLWIATACTALSTLMLLIGPLRRHRDLPQRPAADR